ncbi:unnamed protein product, partial [marine sediment metagenome]
SGATLEVDFCLDKNSGMSQSNVREKAEKLKAVKVK